MSEPTVDLALVWHQHQPNYFDPARKEFLLPWVRLHATKDYYDMADWVRRFPTVHQTFNLVPSLIEQIEMYLDGTSTDTYLRLSEKKAADLSEEERVFALEHFFDVEGATMILPYPRYAQLWRKRGRGPIHEALKRYTVQDFLDLQVWFNLAWTDPLFRENPRDPCHALAEKRQNYTEDDKATLFKRHHEILRDCVPIHREIQDQGLAEIITTPFYHPILPLLVNSDVARTCQPHLELLKPPFVHPEDARMQVAKAVAFYADRFGRRPRGMWPAEGSVSEDVIPVFAGAGVEWIATDEEILAHSVRQKVRGMSVGDVDAPEILYRPYLARKEGHEIRMVFRDHRLSDLIGFDYQGMSAQRAVDDFIARIDRARRKLGNTDYRPLISVILDGENCWAAYPRDGHDFLEELYGRLAEHPHLRCVTVSEHLDGAGEIAALPRLFPGSWINSNYAIWIGKPEDNQAWGLLHRARTAAETAIQSGRLDEERKREVYNEIHIAEGSDWFWWYGDDNNSAHDAMFDHLFRAHLIRVYELIGEEIPQVLYSPIAAQAREKTRLLPQSTMTPAIDGRISHFFEWRPAAVYDPKDDGGAMHRTGATGSIVRLRAGFDTKRFYLCLHRAKEAGRLIAGTGRVRVRFAEPEDRTFEVRLHEDFFEIVRIRNGEETSCPGSEAAERDIVEIALPWRFVPGNPGDEVRFSVQVLAGGEVSETIPSGKVLTFRMPGEHFNEEMWLV